MLIRLSSLALAAAGLVCVQLPMSSALLMSGTVSTGAVGAHPDWTPPSVTVSPAGGPVDKVVSLDVSATDATSAVGSVTVRVRPSGSAVTWTVVCVDTAAPYSCDWDTTAYPDGSYDVQATAVDTYGNVGTSAVSTRTVSHVLFAASDVQVVNGGVLGTMDAGDVLMLTYAGQLAPGSVLAGWDGSPTTAVVRALANGSQGSRDRLDVFKDSGLTTPLHLGAVDTGANYVKNGSTLFLATVRAEPVTVAGSAATRVTVTLGAVSGTSTTRSLTSSATAIWTPSPDARSITGVACSGSPVTESGPLDRDF